MKQAILLTVMMTAHVLASAQQGVIVRQNGPLSEFFYTSTFNADIIETAIQACNTAGGDTLILPGGVFVLSGTNNHLIIDRPVVLIGAGQLSATALVTQPTVLVNAAGGAARDVIVYENVGGFSVHGIRFDLGGGSVRFTNDGTQNVDFFRCDLSTVDLGTIGAGMVNSQIHFQECLIGPMNGWSATAVTFDNCIFKSAPQGFFNGMMTMRNCVVHGWNNTSAGVGNYYHNSILMSNGSGSALSEVDACFNDCVFVCVSAPNMSLGNAMCMTNCATSFNLSDVFASVANLYDLQNDYHVVTAGPADLRDADIYQGPAPWKESAVPFNAHWTGLTVPGTTNGGLIQNVVIQGQAQTH